MWGGRRVGEGPLHNPHIWLKPFSTLSHYYYLWGCEFVPCCICRLSLLGEDFLIIAGILVWKFFL